MFPFLFVEAFGKASTIWPNVSRALGINFPFDINHGCFIDDHAGH